MYRVVNRQVQRIYLRAAVRIQMAVSVGITGGVGFTITSFPSVALTLFYRDSPMHGIVDGQVQRIHLRATMGIRMTVEVITAIRDDSVGTAFPYPGIALTFLNREGRVHRIVDGQVQGIHLPTVIVILVAVGVIATIRDDSVRAANPFPSIALALLNRKGCVHRVVDGQVQRHH